MTKMNHSVSFKMNGEHVTITITEGIEKIKVNIEMSSYYSNNKDIYYLPAKVVTSEFKLHKEVYAMMRRLSNKWRMFEVPTFKSKFYKELLRVSSEYSILATE